MPSPSPSSLNPPKQPRSKRTLERIVRAALDILEEEGPSGVTVQAVVARARSSVGSFYARFGGKEDLLEYLGGRIWGEALERWREAVAARAWTDMDLTELATGAVGMLFDVRRARVLRIRAIDRMTGGLGTFEAFRGHLLQDLETLFLERRDEIVHDPPERAVRLGLRAVMGVLDSDLAPDRAEEDEAREELVRECRDILVGYLTDRRPGAGDPAQVDFFDVWG